MDELIKGIFNAPMATLLVIAGLVFLGIAVIGKISGRIEPSRGGRIASGIIGLILLGIGLLMYVGTIGPPPPPTTKVTPTKVRPTLPEYQTPAPPIYVP
jgi:hypothetical protein